MCVCVCVCYTSTFRQAVFHETNNQQPTTNNQQGLVTLSSTCPDEGSIEMPFEIVN